MANFTAYRHPVLAVACPTCGARVGVWCIRPSEHGAWDLHADRMKLADLVFIKQHGELASVDETPTGYVINPTGFKGADTQMSLILE
ncbi:MAG: hypothetical protein AB2784_21885 [Candidatus Thiodiazotropha endolucinida]